MSHIPNDGCPPGFHDMTDGQQALLHRIRKDTNYGCWPNDLRPALRATDAPGSDKAAVAVFLGGRGAGEEFIR